MPHPNTQTVDMAPVLDVTDLHISADGVPVVSGISFTIAAGQRLGLIGASGSGKTLSCLAVAGLLDTQLTATGQVHITGYSDNLLTASERRIAPVRGQQLGMVFQEPLTALNPTHRIGTQVREAVRLHRGGSREYIAAEALALLQKVGLREPQKIADRYPHELSGGQRQRVVLAIAVANRPPLLICDEPTTALDVRVQAQVLDLIDQQVTATNAALLFVSHNLAIVAAVCDEVLVMSHGTIVERGSVIDVLRTPTHPVTEQLLRDAEFSSLRGISWTR